MSAVRIVEWLVWHTIYSKLQLLRVALNGFAKILSVQRYLAPFFSGLRLLCRQQYRAIKQTGNILLIHHRIKVKPERHFQVDMVAAFPGAAYFEITARSSLQLLRLPVNSYSEALCCSAGYADLYIKPAAAFNSQTGMILFRECSSLFYRYVSFRPT